MKKILTTLFFVFCAVIITLNFTNQLAAKEHTALQSSISELLDNGYEVKAATQFWLPFLGPNFSLYLQKGNSLYVCRNAEHKSNNIAGCIEMGDDPYENLEVVRTSH